MYKGTINYEVRIIARMVIEVCLNPQIFHIASKEVDVKLVTDEVELFFGRKLNDTHFELLEIMYPDTFELTKTDGGRLTINHEHVQHMDIWEC